MTAEVTYRRAGAADIDLLVGYRLRFLAEHFGRGSGDYRDEAALAAELRAYFAEALPQGSFLAWIAEAGGEVVGTSGLVLWRIPPNDGVPNGRLGYILNMYTAPAARGRGICTALLEKLIADARAAGVSRVHLHASKMGEPIYRKRGFHEPGDVELILKVE